jgi:DNA-binding NarL/FixJ family response regulator
VNEYTIGRAGPTPEGTEPVGAGDAAPDGVPSAGLVRVLIADDQQLVREGIASLLSIEPGISVIGTAADGREVIEMAISMEPDVTLMDVRMPGIDGVAAAAVLRRKVPGCRVVMLTTFDDEGYIVQALRVGAVGYLLKDLPAGELAAAVRLAHAGVGQLDSAAVERLASALARSALPGPRQGALERAGEALTAREIDVLRLIAGGSTNREIAAHLFVSEGTVKNHISRILSRLGLRDRTQAAIYARDHGLL